LRHIPGGTSHDAQALAVQPPAGILFVPSINGISHDIAKDATEEGIVLNCQALADTGRCVC
jgi:hypothetical protein